MASRDPRIDAYISDAEPFARPILKALRAAVHAACPGATETVKWHFPFFDYKGPLCTMGAFTKHARFVFWKERPLVAEAPDAAAALVTLKRMTRATDLPARATLVTLIRLAADLNDRGVKGPIAARRDRTSAAVPTPEFVAALAKVPAAKRAFDAFPPSHRREYLTWIADAKRAETRTRRIAQAIDQIQAGKSVNWKYER